MELTDIISDGIKPEYRRTRPRERPSYVIIPMPDSRQAIVLALSDIPSERKSTSELMAEPTREIVQRPELTPRSGRTVYPTHYFG